MKATVRCPGSCGELVQGTTAGSNFLVTCPINLYSEVTVSLSSDPSSLWSAGNKTVEAIHKTLEYLGESFEGIEVRVASELPVGKGMASSSADIAAACLATALAAGRTLDIDEVCKIAIAIEPTDGVFSPGITMIDHVTGKTRHSLGEAPDITIAVLDAGGEVDTIDFNHRSDLAELNRGKEPEVLAALRLVEAGIENQDKRIARRRCDIERPCEPEDFVQTVPGAYNRDSSFFRCCRRQCRPQRNRARRTVRDARRVGHRGLYPDDLPRMS